MQLNASSSEPNGCVLISFQTDKSVNDDKFDLNGLLFSLSQVTITQLMNIMIGRPECSASIVLARNSARQ